MSDAANALTLESYAWKPRALDLVLLDIAVTDSAWRNSWGTDRESDLLDELGALRSEARDMIEQRTGVSWASIEGAGL